MRRGKTTDATRTRQARIATTARKAIRRIKRKMQQS